MRDHRRARRCAIVMLEPREQLQPDLHGLLSGGEPFTARVACLALAPHLGREIALQPPEAAALLAIGETPWMAIDALVADVGAEVVDSLLDKGLLIGDGPSHAALRERDAAVREGHWRPLSAVAHAFSRWADTGVDEDARITRHRSIDDLIAEYGLPPTHLPARTEPAARLPLPPNASQSPLDALFRQRVTCRNFDTAARLSQAQVGALLQRVFGCLAVVDVRPGVCGLKKAHPSGGGLHPLEAYLLLRRVEGLADGLYHYHAGDHALEPLGTLAADAAERLARCFVGGQGFFAEAPVHVALVARFRRTFWKYRNHAKAYRAIVLEAGHVSQDLYLAATEAGLGAYVTAAINEVDIEHAFGLDPLRESPLAVCGFGPRAATLETMELDPLGAVWDGQRRKG